MKCKIIRTLGWKSCRGLLVYHGYDKAIAQCSLYFSHLSGDTQCHNAGSVKDKGLVNGTFCFVENEVSVGVINVLSGRKGSLAEENKEATRRYNQSHAWTW